MALINGITVTLYDKVQSGVDGFNVPIFTETAVTVDDVLVTPVSADDIVTSVNLYGKQAVYELSIPKGDTHIWEDRTVEFFGHKWKTFGFCREWIEDNLPLRWNKKIKVERYG